MKIFKWTFINSAFKGEKKTTENRIRNDFWRLKKKYIYVCGFIWNMSGENILVLKVCWPQNDKTTKASVNQCKI